MPRDILVRPLRKADLPAAARICRLAFGTFLGAPDPETFWADRDYVHGRWRAAHIAAFGAEAGGELVGSNFACCQIAGAIYDGLDLTEEIRTVHAQQLGDTVLISDGTRAAGFAICHYGPTSEAGAGACFIKFAAVQPGASSEQMFGRLIAACERQAAAHGLQMLVSGVNTARGETYSYLRARGFRTEILGIAMHRRNEAGYSRPGVYVIDEWR